MGDGPVVNPGEDVDPLTDQNAITDVPTDRDWFLSSLVNNADDYGSEIGITLNVGGMIITGMLVGGATYFKGFADTISSAFKDPDAAASVRETFAGYAEIYPQRELNEDDENRSPNRPLYIHLRDARYCLNGSTMTPNDRGVWWRGRLAAVDGFNLGTITVSD